MIKNIIFDMGRVLIHWEPKAMASRYGLRFGDAELLVKELFVSPYWVMLDRGTISEEDAAAAVCKKLPPHMHETVEKLTKGWWRRPLTPMEGMAELVKELKENGYNIYLLSNASLKLREYFARIPGSRYFDGLVVSAEEKVIKPEREIYERLYERFGLNPAECFFIDDSPANIEAGMRTGMDGVVFFGDVQRLRRELAQAGVQVTHTEETWISEEKQ